VKLFFLTTLCRTICSGLSSGLFGDSVWSVELALAKRVGPLRNIVIARPPQPSDDRSTGF